MKNNTKIILGTAQFGLDYGVNNLLGQLPEPQVLEVLAYAYAHGIRLLDTAFVYGDSERLIGKFHGVNNYRFQLISKAPSGDPDTIEGYIHKSLSLLNLSSLHGYLVHDFEWFKRNKHIWEKLKMLKNQKIIEKIGFSLYYPHEAIELIEQGIEFDLLQIPFNVFDQRFAGLLFDLKKRNVEIHARSVFLQGMVFKDPSSLPASFALLSNKLMMLRTAAESAGQSVAEACLRFVLNNNQIDNVVLGVDSLNNLKQLLAITSIEGKNNNGLLNDLSIDNEDIILPFRWGDNISMRGKNQ